MGMLSKLVALLSLAGIVHGDTAVHHMWKVEVVKSEKFVAVNTNPEPTPPPAATVSCPDVQYPTVPSPQEIAQAYKIIEQDKDLGPFVQRGDYTSYPAMPPLIPEKAIPDDQKKCRFLSIGVRSGYGLPGKPFHEIIGVNISKGNIIHFPGDAPPGALVSEKVCGFKESQQSPSGRGLAGEATLRVMDGANELWRFTVTRPSASVGELGSGINLKDVYYRNKLVLKSIFSPILNVKYKDNACGPFRDWIYDESPFKATGIDVAKGIRITSENPATIADSGQDAGNFRGVAVYMHEGSVRIVSQLAAGWYRYISEYTLDSSGDISPAWYFSGVENSCVCHLHTHHIYWRIEPAPGGTENQVVEKITHDRSGKRPLWTPVETEYKSTRNDDTYTYYRFKNTATAESYELNPGDDDHFADDFAKGDEWILNPSDKEITDHHDNVIHNVEADIDQYLDPKEPLSKDHVVMWYSAHFDHDATKDEKGNNDEKHVHKVGPTLHLTQW
jgi:hypothetical protein